MQYLGMTNSMETQTGFLSSRLFFEETTVSVSRLISQGPGNNSHYRLVAHWTNTGGELVVEFERLSFECR
jgi:hypothetical protein